MERRAECPGGTRLFCFFISFINIYLRYLRLEVGLSGMDFAWWVIESILSITEIQKWII